MRVFIAKRVGVADGNVPFCDIYVGKTQEAAIKAIVDGGMRDWWHDFTSINEEFSPDAPAEEIFRQYVDMFSDEEAISVEEEEVSE
jgi:hypothetical protein